MVPSVLTMNMLDTPFSTSPRKVVSCSRAFCAARTRSVTSMKMLISTRFPFTSRHAGVDFYVDRAAVLAQSVKLVAEPAPLRRSFAGGFSP